MRLSDAVIGLKAYKEVDQRTRQLWQDIDTAILSPRMDISQETLPGIHVASVSGSRSLSTEDALMKIRMY